MASGVNAKLSKIQLTIGRRVRELRLGRRWTQAELASELGLSQGRLSELERGEGSFTAEQLVVILQLFNVGAAELATGARSEPEAEVQNVLARLGATHLQERADVLASSRVEDVAGAIREALALGSPRLVTALAPVLVNNLARLNLPKLRSDLTEAGIQRRLDWVIDNTLEAIAAELRDHTLSREDIQRYRQAQVELDIFRAFSPPPRGKVRPDVLDRYIRSKETLTEVQSSSSPASRRWGVVTAIVPDDFAAALKESRARV